MHTAAIVGWVGRANLVASLGLKNGTVAGRAVSQAFRLCHFFFGRDQPCSEKPRCSDTGPSPHPHHRDDPWCAPCPGSMPRATGPVGARPATSTWAGWPASTSCPSSPKCPGWSGSRCPYIQQPLCLCGGLATDHQSLGIKGGGLPINYGMLWTTWTSRAWMPEPC